MDRTTIEERAALDLSSWRVAFTGAEPIRSETLQRFIKTFAPCGFQAHAFTPGYGLAELTLMVSTKYQTNSYSTYFLERSALESGRVVEVDPGNTLGREFVGCGEVLPDQEVVIVDPETQASLPKGQVGEIWVSSSSVAQGYWANPAETRAIFHARAKDRGDQTYLRTGDLGFLKNGELVVTGRFKDIIIINGRNFYAEDIELTIREIHPALQADSAAAFAIEKSGLEQLVIVCEVKREHRNANVDEVSRLIRRAIAENHELAVHDIVLIKPLSIPRTTSNKIQRSACKDSYRKNELERIGIQTSEENESVSPESVNISGKPRTPTEASLCFIWAEALGVEQVGIYDNFFELGGSSLIASKIASRVEGFFQIEVPMSILLDGPTVAHLANVIENRSMQNKFQDGRSMVQIDRSNSIPCSYSQERLWFLDQLVQGNPAYNNFYAVQLSGTLNSLALKDSLNEIVRRHEVLRTTFEAEEGRPIQIISPTWTLAIPTVELSSLTDDERELRISHLCIQEAQLPFDLTKGPLIRATLLRINDQEHVLLLTTHHIISDGWSVGVFVREMAALYEAHCEGKPSPLPELAIQYADFAHWQRQWYQGEILESQLSYWRQQLDNAPPALALYTDHQRPAVQTFRGSSYTFTLSKDLSEALKGISRQVGCTLFMTLLTAFQILLSRYTGQEDIVIGTPVANRNRTEIEGLIGFFVNTLALRTNLSDDPGFQDLLLQVRAMTLGAFAHQDLPFEKLVEELKPERNLSQNPLVQVMFVLQNAPLPALEFSGLTLNPLDIDNGTAKFDLTLMMMETEQGLKGVYEYNSDLFDETTIQRMAGRFQTLLNGIIANPSLRVSELPLLTEAERHQLLVEMNETRVEYHKDFCIHQLFETQVEQKPESFAVAFNDQQVTYDELNRRANQLAHYLQNIGVGPEVLVGICVERSHEMVIGILGILKAGGAYVPLDPAYPKERLAFILKDFSSNCAFDPRTIVDRSSGAWSSDSMPRYRVGKDRTNARDKSAKSSLAR